jgi:hypothetical protein
MRWGTREHTDPPPCGTHARPARHGGALASDICAANHKHQTHSSSNNAVGDSTHAPLPLNKTRGLKKVMCLVTLPPPTLPPGTVVPPSEPAPPPPPSPSAAHSRCPPISAIRDSGHMPRPFFMRLSLFLLQWAFSLSHLPAVAPLALRFSVRRRAALPCRQRHLRFALLASSFAHSNP